MFKKLDRIYHEFPPKFWVLVGASFIDGIGGTLLFPFFALYLTQKFGIGMTQAGILLGMFSLAGLVGTMIGGALTDRFGRKNLLLFGLVFSALSTLSIGMANSLAVMYPLALFVGLLSNMGHPAHQAMVADMLPEEKRPEGFSVMRVVFNLAWIIGPTIGGVVAARSFMTLFILDSILSCVTAVIVFFAIPETKPQAAPEKHPESLLETLAGYRLVARNPAFMAFMLATILMMVVYQQAYNTLSVFLRDQHGVSAQGYGFLMTSSAITVVLFQFWVSRVIKYRPPFLMVALGTVFFAIGFAMYGFVSAYALFITAIVIITIGEMIVFPTGQTLTANFAPEDMRGRYMAAFGLTFTIPSTFGPGLAGYILDNFNPNLLWQIGGGLCLLSTLGFYLLHLRLGRQARFAPPERKEEKSPALA